MNETDEKLKYFLPLSLESPRAFTGVNDFALVLLSGSFLLLNQSGCGGGC